MKPSLGILLAVLLLSACGEPASPEKSLADLQQNLAGSLPEGWQVKKAGEAGIPLPAGVTAGDLLVLRPGAVPLNKRPGQEAAGNEVLAFRLLLRPWIEPAKYSEARRAIEDVRRQHQELDRTVAQMPRDGKGQPIARDADGSGMEVAAVAKWTAAKAQLPPIDETLPTHYSGRIAVQVIDTRPLQVPQDLALQREQNMVFGKIRQALEAYPAK